MNLMDKFRKHYPQWDDIIHSVIFYRYNPHSIPYISKIMCNLGRHDFEPLEVHGDNKSVTLECFYCQKRKKSQVMRP